MKKRMLLGLLFVCCFAMFAPAQSADTTVYKGEGFRLAYPTGWKQAQDGDILNFYPEDESAAITISVYKGVKVSVEELKGLLAEVTCKDEKGKDDVKTGGKDNSDFYYQCSKDDVHWIARMLVRGENLFFITLNCGVEDWNKNSKTFTAAVDSFITE